MQQDSELMQRILELRRAWVNERTAAAIFGPGLMRAGHAMPADKKVLARRERRNFKVAGNLCYLPGRQEG